MEDFVCSQCGQAFSPEKGEQTVCPYCGTVQADLNIQTDNWQTGFTAGGQMTAEQTASLDEFRAGFSKGAKERAFSISKMKSSISDENADIPDYTAPAEEDEEEIPLLREDEIFYRHETVPDPEPTKREIRKARRFAKRDEKIRIRNEKIIEKYKKATNKPLIFFAVILLVLIGVLSLMYYNGLTFFDLPDVISDLKNKPSVTDTAVTAIAFSDVTQNENPLPATGAYTVTTGEGINMRMAASTAAEKIITVPYGVTVTATAFSFDGELQTYWARVSYDGHIGWIVTDGLERNPDADVIG